MNARLCRAALALLAAAALSLQPTGGSSSAAGPDRPVVRVEDQAPQRTVDPGPQVRVDRVDARTRAIVRNDPTAHLDDTGHLYYVDRAIPESARAAGPAPAAPYPYSQTFTLHSKPGSAHTIYLDFDGAHVANTAWNDPNGSALPAGDVVGWDPSGDGFTSFSPTEQDTIQSVWQRVAEDYAPFDVDVTTQDPGDSVLASAYGTRVVVTQDDAAWQTICNRQCGGIAYIGVFALTGAQHAYYQPALIFTGGTGDEAKGIAEASAHEVGHNMGLHHDGVSGGAGYYEGHGNWAPIMGAAYYQPVSQWSRGEYTNANQAEDDVAVIAASTLGYRTDEASNTPATASPLPSGTAFITNRGDVDHYQLGQCSGPVTVTATPAPTSPDLDIALSLLDGSGNPVASADPASGRADDDTATGMAASISTSVASGQYVVAVDGVGNGSPTTGYNDYGSLGAYALTASGCGGGSSTVPSVPTSVAAVRDSASSATLTWSAPADDGGSPVTGYQVQLDSGGWSGVGLATSHQFTGLDAGAHTLAVRAVNAIGPGTPAQATVAAVGSVPSAVQNLQGSVGSAGQVTVSWDAPASDGGSPITGYEVEVGGQVETVGPAVRSVTINGLPGGQTSTIVVRAVNAMGAGPDTSVDVQVPATTPAAPEIGRASPGAVGGRLTVVARWSPPSQTGSGPVTGYRVWLYLIGARGQVLHTWATRGLIPPSVRVVAVTAPKAGTYRLAVQATNDVGWGPRSARSNAVKAR